ncbi:uncharacterized protein [Asterias amurensis]|uniref:uncharacterized protein n=1 Tax=Asterias amurensis TaxID=7602 RepID=UPI003AB3FF86
MNHIEKEQHGSRMDALPPIRYSATLPHPRKGVWGAATSKISPNPSITTGEDLRHESDTLAERCQNSEERVNCQLRMLRRELKAMRVQDQSLLRQLLRIYGMISDLYGNAQDRSPSNQHKASIMPDEVPDLLVQSGHLDIRDVVSRLSPIRRRRGSDPEALFGDVSLGSLDFDETEVEDVFSMSCPVFI